MRPAAPRILLGWAAALLIATWLWGAENPARSAPTRPAPAAEKTTKAPPVTAPKRENPPPKPAAKTTVAPAAPRSPKIEYIGLKDVATRLGLKATWDAATRKAVLTDQQRRIELLADSREARINGLRVFLGSPAAVRRGQLEVSRIDFDTCLVPLLKPSLIQRVPPRPKVVALDPGHGGVDQGTQNPRLGLKEKEFTLDVSRRLKALLERKGYTVVLTRDADERLDLQSRAIIANRANADMFVSIHFNALPNDQKTRGTEIFTFAPAHQRSTNAWSPGASDDTEHDPAPGNRYDAANAMLAHALHRELLAGLQTFDRGKKIGHLGVLRGLNCPGVLVESGFLSNDEEARKIATPAYRQSIAEALAAGIADYTAIITSLQAKR